MTNPTGVRQRRVSAAAGGGVDPRSFRDVLGRFASGLVVITGMADGEPVGLTCQAFVSLSIDPPLVAFCPSLTSVSWRRLRSAGAFCANILADDQRELSNLFGQRRDDKFALVGWRRGVTGAPLVEGAVAHVECEIEDVYAGGDHEVIIGRVVALATAADRMPLLFYRGRYATLATSPEGAIEA